jgi:hypothetical protein
MIGLLMTLHKIPGTDEDEDIYGYDLRALYQKYDPATDKLYFRIDVDDMPADLDGNGNPDTVCNPPPLGSGDCPGIGPTEAYTIVLQNIGGGSSTVIEYKNNVVTVTPGGSASGAYTTTGDNRCLEFCLDDAGTHVNPFGYCAYIAAGGTIDILVKT